MSDIMTNLLRRVVLAGGEDVRNIISGCDYGAGLRGFIRGGAEMIPEAGGYGLGLGALTPRDKVAEWEILNMVILLNRLFRFERDKRDDGGAK